MPDAVVIPVLGYADVLAAAEWLRSAFGFRERLRIGDHRVQLDVSGGGAVVVAQHSASALEQSAFEAHSVMVRVADVDAHYARVVAQGAQILDEPTTHPYGERQYSAVDLGGHRWTFSQSIADVAPAEWGGFVSAEEAGSRRRSSR